MASDLMIEHVSFLTPRDVEEVFNLWNNEYPSKMEYFHVVQLDVYLDEIENPYHLLLYNRKGNVLGWAFSFDRDGERWFAILIDHSIQRQGYGRSLLNQLKMHEPILNGWVVDRNRYKKTNGEPYLSPLKFYKKCGFEVLSDQRLELEIISAVKIRWTSI